MEAQLSAGIVSLKAAVLNIPEADCCAEAVDTPSNSWRTSEKQFDSKKTELDLIRYV